MELRRWQKEALEYFFTHDKNCLMAVPTGAGKSFLAIQIIKKLLEDEPNLKILIVVPKNVIIDKTWVPELQSQGFMWDKVGIFNGSCKEYSRITLTTTVSVHNINKKIFDFIIADEVHGWGTEKLKEVLSMKFKYRLGLSATPDRTDFQHWNIYRIFDFNVYEYSVKDALKDKVLNDFEFYDISIKLDPETRAKYEEVSEAIAGLMRTIGGYYKFMSLPGSDKNKLALMKYISQRKDLIWNYKEKMRIVFALCKEFEKDSKILVFSQYNKMTNNLYYYLSSEKIRSEVLHSGVSDKERQNVIREFSDGNLNIMLCTKVGDEGMNIVGANIGIILAGEKGERQTIQRMGRVLRKKDKPSKLFQIYCTNTFEEESAIERAKIFKDLCCKYDSIVVDV